MNRKHAQKHSTGAIKALSLRGIGRYLENLRAQRKYFFVQPIQPVCKLLGIHSHQAIKTAGETALGALGIAHNTVHCGELSGVAF